MPGPRRSSSRTHGRGRAAAVRLLVLPLALALVAACSARRPPVLQPLRDLEARPPVVLIPGITGTRLRDRETGRVVWGNARSVFFPRDGGYSLALPIDESAGTDRLDAFSPVIRIRVAGVTVTDVYGALIRLMEANGYRLGDLRHPRPGDTFFLFPYDWRRENLSAVRELADRLENLRRVRGEEVLRVDLICQSNAARIARYLVKYGVASLEQAESGAATPPTGIAVGKLILVGAANGGALATLEELDRGRSYVPAVGRKFLPETVFTFRSIYEELPAYRRDLFFDVEGRTLAVDLFDPASWKRYGWSVYGSRVRKRLARRARADLFGDEASRAAYLAENLDRARRLHELLIRDSAGFGRTEYYLLHNGYLPTPDRALLSQDDEGEWHTYFGGQREVEADPLLDSLASAPGDAHATLASLAWLSPQEREALAAPAARVPSVHRKIILHEAAHRWILRYLLEGPRQADPTPASPTP